LASSCTHEVQRSRVLFIDSKLPGECLIAETTCLITDLQMPELNGLELQEALRSQGYQTPVIVITAYPNKKHRTRAFANGAVGFLSKPFNEQCLIECARHPGAMGT
jgi:FixJ family two-component response regulator